MRKYAPVVLFTVAVVLALILSFVTTRLDTMTLKFHCVRKGEISDEVHLVAGDVLQMWDCTDKGWVKVK
jgi:hypothetical protein